MSRLVLFALALLVVGCSSPPPVSAIRDVAVGQPFTTKVGERVRTGDRLVRIVSVEDGRCPKNVQCVWPGIATVTVDLNGREVTLRTEAKQGPIADAASPVELWEVLPYPGSPEALRGDPVRVTLAVLSAGD